MNHISFVKTGISFLYEELIKLTVANVIFLKSPAGVGFSYSNKSSDHITTGDKQTEKDSYAFLTNWLERYPQYKSLTGEIYAGRYVLQLASLFLPQNKRSNQTLINLNGIAVGNALIDETTWLKGMYEFYWTHSLILDEAHAGIKKFCDFEAQNYSTKKCNEYQGRLGYEIGDGLDLYNIYSPLFHLDDVGKHAESLGSVKSFDPCTYDMSLYT
ncbi:serine carboxypeptidase II-3-like protein [Tanacetum coccineum]